MWKDLTHRQMQIVELLEWGATQKMVANALEISAMTVNKTMSQIYKKLDMDTTELRQKYNIEVLGVDPALCPLDDYNFTPRITHIAKIYATCLLVLTMVQLSSLDTDFMRTTNRVRSTRSCRSRNKGITMPIGGFEIELQ